MADEIKMPKCEYQKDDPRNYSVSYKEPQVAAPAQGEPLGYAVMHVNIEGGVWKLLDDKRSAEYWATQGFPVQPLYAASHAEQPTAWTGLISIGRGERAREWGFGCPPDGIEDVQLLYADRAPELTGRNPETLPDATQCVIAKVPAGWDARDALANALDSLTVAELSEVFGRDYKATLSKSYSQQIVDILAPKLAQASSRSPAASASVICRGCGSARTDEQLAAMKAADPKIVSCCPERDALDIRGWMERATRLEEQLNRRSQPDRDIEVFMTSNAALTSEVLQLRANVERLRASVDQIHGVAKDNQPETCNARMALRFIQDVARVTLSSTNRQETT